MKFFLIVLLSIMIMSGCSDGIDDISLIEKGDLAFARRDYAIAATIWNNAYRKDPNNSNLMEKLAECYIRLGRLERAKLVLQKAIETFPGKVDIQVRLAQLFVLTLDFSSAQEISEKLEKQGFNSPEFLILKADLSLMKDNREAAEKFYRKAVIVSKDSFRALMKLAIFLKSANREEESFEIFSIVQRNKVLDPKIFLLTADYYLLGNDYQNAEASIKNAIRIEPEEIGLQYYLLNFYISIGQNDKAESLLKRMLEIQDDMYLWMTLADLYLINGRYDKAEGIILKLKKIRQAKTAGFELLQGKFWLYSGQPVFATSHFKSALSLKPGLVNTRYYLGLTHLINGKIKLSENSLSQTLLIQPSHHHAQLLISELLYKKKEYELSLSYLTQFLAKYPEDFTGLVLKGLNLLGQNKYLRAKKQFQKAQTLSHDKQYIAHYYTGLSNEKLKNFKEALKNYSSILKTHPHLIDVSYRYCLMLLKNGKQKNVQDFIAQRLASGSQSPEFYYIFAKVAAKMGAIPEQEKLLKKAIELDDSASFLFLELSTLYKNSKKFKDSKMILEKCTQLNPYYEEAWLALSQSYLESRDIQTALKILENGFEKFKDSPLYQSNIAWLYLENEKEMNKALDLAQKAYEKMPDNLAVADTLGWAYYHKRIFSQATWLLSDIEKKAPDNGYIQYHLGMTYYQQGNFEKATVHLNKAKISKVFNSFSMEIDNALSDLKNKENLSTDKPSIEQNSIIEFPKSNDTENDLLEPQWMQ
ncbi:MAG: tetratricopeptide repeat protein [Desulfobacula sp.]|nr:tetratricopeptide repeat protein [Desulfobacula sp.]